MTKITLLLIALHFVSDQMIQPKLVKEKKHKSSLLMWAHVLTWSIPFFVFMMGMILKTNDGSWLGWWATITIMHFLIEWPINRWMTHRWYGKKLKEHAMWSQLETVLTILMIIGTFMYFQGI